MPYEVASRWVGTGRWTSHPPDSKHSSRPSQRVDGAQLFVAVQVADDRAIAVSTYRVRRQGRWQPEERANYAYACSPCAYQYSSAEDTGNGCIALLQPPSTRTTPSASTVAVWDPRAVIKLPVADDVLVAGS